MSMKTNLLLVLLLVLLIAKNLAQDNLNYYSDNVCINGENCYLKSIINMRMKTHVRVLKRIECPCIGKLTYKCVYNARRSHLCTLNKNVCDKIKIIKLNIIVNKTRCGNNDSIL